MIEDKIKSGRVSVGKTGLYISAQTENGFDISMHIVNLPELSTFGISNICEDRYLTLFMDYDNIKYEDLIRELKYLDQKFDISHFLILTTGNNKYHVISFEKFELPELSDIIHNSICDYSYKDSGIITKRGWKLRFTPKVDYDGKVVKDKPEFVSIIDGSNIKKRKISRAHLEFFCKIYPFFGVLWKDNFHDMLKDNYDDDETVKLSRYGTSNKDFLMDNDFGGLLDSKRLSIEWINSDDDI